MQVKLALCLVRSICAVANDQPCLHAGWFAPRHETCSSSQHPCKCAHGGSRHECRVLPNEARQPSRRSNYILTLRLRHSSFASRKIRRIQPGLCVLTLSLIRAYQVAARMWNEVVCRVMYWGHESPGFPGFVLTPERVWRCHSHRQLAKVHPHH